jgi:hypothetical protein
MSASIEKMKAMNIDMTLFAKVLAKHGVSPDNGFVNVRDFNDPEDLFNLFKDMPFAEKPAFDLDSIAGREASLRWDERNVAWKDHLKKTGRQEADTAFSVLAKVVDSIQFTVMQQTISKQLVARFNFEAEGKTYAQAIKEGYVTLTGSGNQFNFFLPGELSPEAGNLFHPDIAKSIAWINREHNRTFSSGNMPKWAHGVLQTTQFFKAFQTVMRPGHWFTNTIGDTSTAMLAGALNPKHWKMAASLAGEFAKSNIKADSRLFGELEDSLGRALGSLDGLGGRAFDMVEKQGQKHYQFVVGGKRISIPTSELLKLMKDHNVVAGDIHVNDSAMLYQEIAAHAGGDKKGNSVVLSKLSQGFNRSAFGLAFQKVIKPAGDMVAYTGNIPRIAHALHVMQGQNWSSVKAMLEGANDKLSLYHPMVQSLTATERKTARVAFSYYTWLRVAHNTMLDLTLNHTAATMIPPKIFYAMSEASGNDPQSVGNLWGDKTKSPEYLDYSVYGPNMTGVRGPMVWRPPILTMDVMSTWNTAFDPAISDDANLWENIGKVATNLVSQSNMVLQPIGQIATKTNPSTGAPERITSTGQFIDKYYGMLPFTRVAEALGAPNPFVDKSKKANPPTERDKELTILNYLFGQRLMDVNKPSSLKNAKTENNQKLKDIATLINEQKQKESK